MIQVWMLILSVIALSAHATDFNYIKLNPQFEQYLNQPKLKSFRPSTKSLVSDSRADEYAQKIRVSLLGANTGAGDFNNPFPSDGEESLLYQEIRTHLEASNR